MILKIIQINGRIFKNGIQNVFSFPIRLEYMDSFDFKLIAISIRK